MLHGLAKFRFIWPDLFTAYERFIPGSKNTSRPLIADIFLSWFPAMCPDLLVLHVHPRQRIPIHQYALDASRRLEDKKYEGIALGHLGLAYIDLGEIHKSIPFFEQELAINRARSDYSSEGKTLGNLGSLYARLGQGRRAIEFYEQAIDIARKFGDRGSEGMALGNLGRAYQDLGETRKAIEYYKRALKAFNEIGDRHSEGDVLSNLGTVYSTLGETYKAIKFYEQVIDIARKFGDRRSEGTALGNLGGAYQDLGETRKAMEYYERALKAIKEIGDRRSEGAVLNNLGLIYSTLGQTEKAIEFYEKSLVINREIGDKLHEGQVLVNLGTAFKDLDQKAEVRRSWQQALAIFRTIEDPQVEAEWVQNGLDKLNGIGQKEYSQLMTLSDFVRTVIQIARTNNPQARQYSEMLSRMTSDKKEHPQIQELVRVLNEILAGSKNPNISKLEKELAAFVHNELNKNSLEGEISAHVIILKANFTREQIELIDKIVTACKTKTKSSFEVAKAQVDILAKNEENKDLTEALSKILAGTRVWDRLVEMVEKREHIEIIKAILHQLQ